VPPFQNVSHSVFPEALRRDFAAMPGVEIRHVTESDIGQNRVWETAAPPS
jgi:hypothetical protein